MLLPKKKEWAEIPELLLAASAIRLQVWRYNYGRKITPLRLASSVKLTHSDSLRAYAADMFRKFERVISASLEPYETEDETDIRVAKKRIAEIDDDPEKLVSGVALAKRLAKLETQ